MPTVPPKTLADLPRAVRDKFKRLAYERAVLGYAFSFERLEKAFRKMALDSGDHSDEDIINTIKSCIAAWKDDECKQLKESLGNKITDIYTENDIPKTLRAFDPFGHSKDYIMAEGVSVSFSQNKALELGVAGICRWKCPVCEHTVFTVGSKIGTECPTIKKDGKGNDVTCEGVITSKTAVKEFAFNGQALKALFDLATTRTKYVSLQARDVKEGK